MDPKNHAITLKTSIQNTNLSLDNLFGLKLSKVSTVFEIINTTYPLCSYQSSCLQNMEDYTVTSSVNRLLSSKLMTIACVRAWPDLTPFIVSVLLGLDFNSLFSLLPLKPFLLATSGGLISLQFASPEILNTPFCLSSLASSFNSVFLLGESVVIVMSVWLCSVWLSSTALSGLKVLCLYAGGASNGKSLPLLLDSSAGVTVHMRRSATALNTVFSLSGAEWSEVVGFLSCDAEASCMAVIRRDMTPVPQRSRSFSSWLQIFLNSSY